MSLKQKENTHTRVCERSGSGQASLHFQFILLILLEKVKKKSQLHFSVTTVEQAEEQLHVNPSSTIAVI